MHDDCAMELCTSAELCRIHPWGTSNLMANLLRTKATADAFQSAATVMVMIYMLNKLTYLCLITVLIKQKGHLGFKCN